MTDRTDRSTDGNPMLAAYLSASPDDAEARDTIITSYGFGIPTATAVDAIKQHAPHGVIEIGAGTGYWARLLDGGAVDVIAFDVEPPPSAKNPWFAGTLPWHPVERGDHTAVAEHTQRMLLLVWPTKNELWAADACALFHSAGGTHLAYVGEEPGGRTGDDVFHARLGDLEHCMQCHYDIDTAPCICDIEPLWRRVQTVELPHWQGFHDDLHLYVRREAPVQRRTWLARRAHKRLERNQT